MVTNLSSPLKTNMQRSRYKLVITLLSLQGCSLNDHMGIIKGLGLLYACKCFYNDINSTIQFSSAGKSKLLT